MSGLLQGDTARVRDVAFADGAYVMLYNDSNWAFLGGIPKGLLNKLWGRQQNLPPLVNISFGPSGQYYIEFADGRSQWHGPDDLGDALHEERHGIVRVAFGPWGEWLILVKNGGYNSSGNLPPSLINKLHIAGPNIFLPPRM